MEEGQEILDKRYKIIKRLGAGAFGEVWKVEKKKTGDDPYYFGLSARIPNFVKSRKKKQKERNRANTGQVHLT